jgi:hypothetical protein
MLGNIQTTQPDILDLDGKIYKHVNSGFSTYDAGVVTYYKFGKYNANLGYYNTINVQVNPGNRMTAAYPHNYPTLHIKANLARLTEVTPSEFYYIMRDAIDNYAKETKASLGITDKEPELEQPTIIIGEDNETYNPSEDL